MAVVRFFYEEDLRKRFLPLTHLKGVEDLRSGIYTFARRIELLTKDREGTLFIRPNVILHDIPDSDVIGVDGEVVAVWAESEEKARDVFERGAYDGPEVRGHIVRNFYELPHVAPDVVIGDMEMEVSRRREEFIRYGDAYLHRTVPTRRVEIIGPGLVDEGAVIEPFTVLKGPFYVGRKSLVKPFSYVISSVIGPVCKVSGEISHTVFSSYSNKQHSGFIGHSYVGEWVNIGAGTEVSNLKNTYGTVKVYSYAAGDVVDTGLQFAGTFIGDHAKVGINTTISTGTVIGIFANVTASDSPTPKFVPDFYWTGGKRMRLDKALEVARRVMARRDVVPSGDYLRRIEEVYTSLANGPVSPL